MADTSLKAAQEYFLRDRGIHVAARFNALDENVPAATALGVKVLIDKVIALDNIVEAQSKAIVALSELTQSQAKEITDIKANAKARTQFQKQTKENT